MTAIYLIRHAETALNASRVVQFPDTPLNHRGQWQADRLATRLLSDGVTHVASSDLVRARATAERIRDATQAPLHLDERLRERDLGDLRGRPYAEVRGQVFGEGFDPPRGETWDTFTQRVDLVWGWVEQFVHSLEGVLALVTHGLVCQALARRHLAVGEHPHPLRFPNATVTIIKASPPWRVEVLASDTHLRMCRTEEP